MLTFNTLRWSMQNGEKYEPYKNQWAITLSKFGQKSIWKFLENGGGILALHTAVICFDLWSEWGKILGAEWVWDNHITHLTEKFLWNLFKFTLYKRRFR